ncbi:hypothetical protein ARMGADRAFT_63145 [Armillaria gallica]|uniref:Uncharacterized protein n=1 Tax=Armillaria gallica TaxID=47427 RepID=A0A2H3DKU2_ARMGA|nr:hypothetical protein ARMGADRAFT_63145 [Armillaria gallica]
MLDQQYIERLWSMVSLPSPLFLLALHLLLPRSKPTLTSSSSMFESRILAAPDAVSSGETSSFGRRRILFAGPQSLRHRCAEADL